jgi:hypothetical protein
MGGMGAILALAHYLVAADCLDEYIQRTVNEKRDAVWQTLDTDAGARPVLDAPAPDPDGALAAKAQCLKQLWE